MIEVERSSFQGKDLGDLSFACLGDCTVTGELFQLENRKMMRSGTVEILVGINKN